MASYWTLGIIALLFAFAQGCGDSGAPVSGTTCTASFSGPEVAGQEVSVDTVTEIAQSITLAAAATPGSLQLKLKAIGTPTGSVYVRIETSLSSAPSGFIVENATLDATKVAAAPAADAFYTFTFSTPQALAVGTYWIILKGNASFTATGVSWMATNVSGAYTGGTALSSSNDSSWGVSQVSGKGLLFLFGC